jgi:hypothetical protein
MGASLHYTSLSFSSVETALSPRIPAPPLRDGAIAGLNNVGIAAVQDDHWDRLTRLNSLLTQELTPQETYLDLTNRHAQYFYMNRHPALAVTAPYNMVAPAQQRRALADLSLDPPRLALLEADNIVQDGGGLALRNPLLYRFVVDNYVPTWQAEFVVGHRKRDVPANGGENIQMQIGNLTDVNWDKGVNRSQAGIVLAKLTPIVAVSVGSQVRLANGEFRKVTGLSREDGAIWLDGATLDPTTIGAPKHIVVTIETGLQHEFKMALLEKAFAVSDLASIPVAWGKSEVSLSRRMVLVKAFESIEPAAQDLVPQSGSYRISGNDPSLSFDISSLGISGHDAGLLRFAFRCLGRSSVPRIQVFWWGDAQAGPSEAASLRFTADTGILIVPMDASPRWLTMKQIRGLRFDLDNPAACHGISIKNIALYQRKAVLED